MDFPAAHHTIPPTPPPLSSTAICDGIISPESENLPWSRQAYPVQLLRWWPTTELAMPCASGSRLVLVGIPNPIHRLKVLEGRDVGLMLKSVVLDGRIVWPAEAFPRCAVNDLDR